MRTAAARSRCCKRHSITFLSADSQRVHGSGNDLAGPFAESGQIDRGWLSTARHQLAHAVSVSIVVRAPILLCIAHGERRALVIRTCSPCSWRSNAAPILLVACTEAHPPFLTLRSAALSAHPPPSHMG